MSESNINPQLRRQSMELARCPVAHEALLGDTYTPVDSSKMKYFAAVAPLVEHIVNLTVSEPLQDSAHQHRRVTGWERFRENMKEHMRATTKQTVDKIQTTPDEETLDKLFATYRENVSRKKKVQDNLIDGTVTAAHVATDLLRAYAPLAGTLPSENRKPVLHRSVSDVLAMTSYSVPQIAMVFSTAIHEGHFPKAVLRKGKRPNDDRSTIQLETSPLDLPMTDYLRLDFESRTGGRTNARTIGELTTRSSVIGCPILFRPKQVQRFWNWTVDQAVARGLIG
jgi:hypothetical protein